ncbi:SDR family NAD(P)-dependent oxidoreductase [Micromonospora sp. FIMYZ51]|uniref:type I polyketide synthase n=1 Tax=Micromonospora sp. FIMYZ51 TaxID=3051832 RepID=UPI00311EB34A
MTEAAIAIVGMAARVPGAGDVETFWANVLAGHEAMVETDDEVSLRHGAKASSLAAPGYRRVYAGATDLDLFDADFFGLNPREAALADPQFRLFLELAHAGLEAAGYEPTRDLGRVGVYGGSAAGDYRERYIEANPGVAAAAGGMSIRIGNNADYIAPLVSYKLGFQGPSVSVYTACSTSLVAVHLGIQALLLDEIDVAVAGGVQVDLPLETGYLHEPGGIRSADGHVRPFSADASGTIFSNGGATVVLKRLADALAAGDVIHGVLLGSAISNDGDQRAGFTAPGADGQIKVVRAALDRAGLTARAIGLMEAHGTGTVVGDPIEFNALTDAYRQDTGDTGFCRIGSVKGNVGHLGPAAGVAGLIKATLAVRDGIIPPTINWAPVNPAIALDSSPFELATSRQTWEASAAERIAAVSSFGIGGTNAHVVVTGPPPVASRPPVDGPHLLTLSARSAEALDEATGRLADHLDRTEVRLDDTAYTLARGRGVHPFRRTVVARDPAEAARALRESVGRPAGPVAGRRDVAFLLPGQGAQYPGMGHELYRTEAVYRAAVDECAAGFAPLIGLDLRELLHADPSDAQARTALAQTSLTQPAIFTVEWALSALWRSRDVTPSALIGHSIGELAAATIAGVFPLEDALRVVAARGRLMQSAQPGAMLALPLSADAVTELLPTDLEVAAANSPSACVVTGAAEAIDRFAVELDDIGITGTRLRTSHAFHSRAMDPVLDEFASVLEGVRFGAPQIPFLSNVSGDWADPGEVMEPGYWVAQLRRPVLFADGVTRLLRRGEPFLLEVGPGRALGGFARQAGIADGRNPAWAGSLPAGRDGTAEPDHLLGAVGALWAAGVPVDVAPPRTPDGPRRVVLPGYPYQRRRHWVDPDPTAARAAGTEQAEIPTDPMLTPFYVPVWKQVPRGGEPADVYGEHWLVVGADADFGPAALSFGVTVTRLDPGELLIEDFHGFIADLADAAQIKAVLGRIWATGPVPDRIVLDLGPPAASLDAAAAHRHYRRSAVLASALLDVVREPIEIVAVTHGMFSIAGESADPSAATAFGPLGSLPAELPVARVRHIDGLAPAARLVDEIRHAGDEVVALRGHRRHVRSYDTVPNVEVTRSVFRSGGVYVITGGLGGIGATIAEDLARVDRARLVLVGRSGLPDRETWSKLLEADDTDAVLRDRIEAVRRMEACGAQVRVLAADVADAEALRQVFATATAEFGVVHGVVHAAGLPGGQLLALHDQDAAARVLRPKVDALVALYQSAADVEFIALCSSIVAVTSAYGLCDYAAANLYLDAFAHAVADRPDGPRVVSINWLGWREVGMVSEQGASEGVQALRAMRLDGQAERIEHPFLSSVTVEDSGRHRYRGTLQPDGHWALAEHRIAGEAVVPATMLLESVRAAAHHAFGAVPIRIQDVLLIDPIVVTGPMTLTLSLDPADGVFEVTVGERVHCRGMVRVLTEQPPPPVELPELEPASVERASAGLVDFGPRYDVVREYHRTGDTGLVALRAPFEEGLWLHPALLDRAAHGLRGQGGVGYLPFSYADVRVWAPIPAEAWVVQTHRGDPGQPEFIEIDEVIVDADGRICATVGGYTLRAQQELPAQAGAPAPVATTTGSLTLIGNEQGVELFRRMMAVPDQPQLINSAGPLQRRIDQMRTFSTDVVSAHEDAAPVAGSARPASLGAYVPPETDVEVAVAQLWSQSLGITEISLDDEFFVLGGTSLTAVQLASRTRERFGVELSVAELFEHSTVRRLAAVLDVRLDALLDELEAR